MRATAALILALASGPLPGCTLIDQTTFNPEAGKPPVIPPAPAPAVAPPGPPPLLVIGTAGSPADNAALRRAVIAARARKPGVVFNVVEVQPPGARPDASFGQAAARVAAAIVAQGIAAERVRLVLRPEADAPPGQVRVYVQ